MNETEKKLDGPTLKYVRDLLEESGRAAAERSKLETSASVKLICEAQMSFTRTYVEALDELAKYAEPQRTVLTPQRQNKIASPADMLVYLVPPTKEEWQKTAAQYLLGSVRKLTWDEKLTVRLPSMEAGNFCLERSSALTVADLVISDFLNECRAHPMRLSRRRGLMILDCSPYGNFVSCTYLEEVTMTSHLRTYESANRNVLDTLAGTMQDVKNVTEKEWRHHALMPVNKEAVNALLFGDAHDKKEEVIPPNMVKYDCSCVGEPAYACAHCGECVDCCFGHRYTAVGRFAAGALKCVDSHCICQES